MFCEEIRRSAGILAEKAEEYGRNQVDWSHGYQPWIGVDKEDPRKPALRSQKAWKIFIKSLSRSSNGILLLERQASGRAACSLHRTGCRLFNLKVCASKPEEEMELGAEVLALLRKN